ncbi:MAG TPA: helix-turn-helix transcriptional regulator [Candidatus Goldiibacteriota bacterium]|nr:helix-turn-helix transcriptional regulator [Candidatus Goldiibacteriota bacterium]HPN64229.1 helix-turn-helix transcriptional regulator [Candidatus Goldiibacteriota bacterium]HRQ42793.1 helix-turn-helix transcriptional regulator [Candidatus Goldiibacteriota bacterium]
MKKQIKKKPTSTKFFDDPRVKKIYADPIRRAKINAHLRSYEFLEDIERLRKAEKMTQSELAKLTKISQEEISRIERGKKNITFETYERILTSLGYKAEIIYHKIHDAHA